MLTALFVAQNPPDSKYTCVLKGGYVPSLLGDIVCAASDSLEALELFSQLLREQSSVATSIGYMAYDAHVGDTACQLRACMIMMLRHDLLRSGETEHVHHHFACLADALRSLIAKAREICRILTERGSNFKAVGLHRAGESRQSLLQKLGWIEPAMEGEIDAGSVRIWNPRNLNQVTRLLIYSYACSKYKRFQRRKHIIGAELDLQLPIQRAARLIEPDFNSENHHFRHWTQQKRAEHDFGCMQIWLSQLSCSWLRSLTPMSNYEDRLLGLMDQTTRPSCKGLTSMSSYVGYLAMRQLWAQSPPPILMVVKRFCSPSSFHVNYFRTTIQRVNGAQQPSLTDPSLQWTLQQVTADELITSDSPEPHLIICGNSIEGTLPDYLHASSIARRHNNLYCPDNQKYCVALREANHDRIAMSTFANHKHYAYALSAEEERDGVDSLVARILEEYEPGLSDKLQRSREEAAELGTCYSLRTLMWQHVFLETVNRLAYHMEAHEETLPLSAPIKM
ncbi:hypothetical protein BDV25DRAFT_148942 [Aspergillus avenaceus]|uniref:Uncharacterized protein n=1 Tax=Aspergillus avenaceus TaxID=36643 RepID=A0A5N6U534_ASPAV|nr:hypothetical protein BDV25DRAFT_148942 [Aspergillus avenaceus]